MCYPEVVVAICRQVTFIFGKDSSQGAQSKDGVSLNDRTLPEKHKHLLNSAIVINGLGCIKRFLVTGDSLCSRLDDISQLISGPDKDDKEKARTNVSSRSSIQRHILTMCTCIIYFAYKVTENYNGQ